MKLKPVGSAAHRNRSGQSGAAPARSSGRGPWAGPNSYSSPLLWGRLPGGAALDTNSLKERLEPLFNEEQD